MKTLNKALLITLLDLAQEDVSANVQLLASELGMPRSQVAGGLNQLAQEGLVRADTIRLTFVGLMQASGLRARRARSGAVAA